MKRNILASLLLATTAAYSAAEVDPLQSVIGHYSQEIEDGIRAELKNNWCGPADQFIKKVYAYVPSIGAAQSSDFKSFLCYGPIIQASDSYKRLAAIPAFQTKKFLNEAIAVFAQIPCAYWDEAVSTFIKLNENIIKDMRGSSDVNHISFDFPAILELQNIALYVTAVELCSKFYYTPNFGEAFIRQFMEWKESPKHIEWLKSLPKLVYEESFMNHMLSLHHDELEAFQQTVNEAVAKIPPRTAERFQPRAHVSYAVGIGIRVNL